MSKQTKTKPYVSATNLVVILASIKKHVTRRKSPTIRKMTLSKNAPKLVTTTKLPKIIKFAIEVKTNEAS